jgi:tRNA pseudouridine55 synthase
MRNSRRSFARNINGILLLDKPGKMTSNAALQTIKNLFKARKAGHTGSLDPLATGMLPICLGEATKFSQFLLEADKRYWVIAQLGIQTTTGDAEGEIVKKASVENISLPKFEEILQRFRGAITQIPSMYSALKHQGRPLYELARQGITIERQARTVHIHELVLLDHTADTLTLEVVCSKGTYIRTLVEDIGEVMGCGAHVAALRRLTAGPYREEQMITLDAMQKLAELNDLSLLDKHLLPVDSAVEHWPLLTLSEAAMYYLKRGQSIIAPYAPSSGWVRLARQSGEFIGVGEILEDGRVAPRRLVQE